MRAVPTQVSGHAVTLKRRVLLSCPYPPLASSPHPTLNTPPAYSLNPASPSSPQRTTPSRGKEVLEFRESSTVALQSNPTEPSLGPGGRSVGGEDTPSPSDLVGKGELESGSEELLDVRSLDILSLLNLDLCSPSQHHASSVSGQSSYAEDSGEGERVERTTRRMWIDLNRARCRAAMSW